MRTKAEIETEIEALKKLAATVPDDALAQASIEGQIEVLKWATRFPLSEETASCH